MTRTGHSGIEVPLAAAPKLETEDARRKEAVVRNAVQDVGFEGELVDWIVNATMEESFEEEGLEFSGGQIWRYVCLRSDC